jgi:hypothetical protein
MATNDEIATAPLGSSAVQRTELPTQSKRDRKRQQLMDRLSNLAEKFSRDRDMTYRDQLQKVQVDANLVQRLDPYSATALDAIAKLRDEYQQYQPQGSAGEARTLLGMAGPKFQHYLQDVEDAIEHKDYLLTRAKVWQPIVDPHPLLAQVVLELTCHPRTSTNRSLPSTKTRTTLRSRPQSESIRRSQALFATVSRMSLRPRGPV